MKKRFYVYFIYVMFLVSCFLTGEPGVPGAKGAPLPETPENRLYTAMQKYNYANWQAETGKVISGLDISGKILSQLKSMSKIWQKDNVSIETIQGTTYAKIRKWWAAADRQLEITMVVCPTFSAAKEYLIYRYANTQTAPQVTKPTGRQLGLKIGNVCYATPARHRPGFVDIDLIRHNVIFMMRAEGDSTRELGTAARILDNLLLKKKTRGHYRELMEIPEITGFSCKKTTIKQGETVLLNLEINNPTGSELYYSWDMSGGGVEKIHGKNFVYYGGEPGTHTIKVTVLNDLGLIHSRSLEIEVVN
jgi:PKD repeat protein